MRKIPLTVMLLLVFPRASLAQTYTVRRGDSLGSIAQSHGLSLDDVIEANALSDPDHIEVGQVLTLSTTEGRLVDGGVVHVVKRGVTLRRIAKAYDVPFSRLVKANQIRNPDVLRLGAEVFVPGADRVIPIATKRREPCLREPVEFYKIREDETLRVVLTQCNGRVWAEGREHLSHFLDRTRDRSAPQLNPNLLRVLQRISDHWPGRRLEVVSAFRAPSNEQRASSRHCQAKALDFRVAGVPNTRLRDFARTLGDVGVGYYPNSTFVHVDTRDSPSFWVDWSGPGEPARYGSLSHDPVDDENRESSGPGVEPRRARGGRGTEDEMQPAEEAHQIDDHRSTVGLLGATQVTPMTAAAP